MLFTEYNEEVHIRNEKNISYKNGFSNCMDIMTKLYNMLKRLNRLEDYDKAMLDTDYRDQLIREFFPDSAEQD